MQPDLTHVYCEACPEGRAGFNGFCPQCYPGTVADITTVVRLGYGATRCIDCPQGLFATTDGKCQQCLAGTQPNSNKTGCEACPPGRAGVDGNCVQCRPLGSTPYGIRAEVPNELRTDCIYTPETVCSSLARQYTNNKTAALRQELHEINVAAKAWRLLPFSVCVALSLCCLYGGYRIQSCWNERRSFGKIKPLKSMLGERLRPNMWVRLGRWIWGIVILICRCQCQQLMLRMRVFCFPPPRAPPPLPPGEPPAAEPYEERPKTPERDFKETVTHEIQAPDAEPAFKFQEHEAEDYEALFD